jgi:hypothetical protein
MAGQERDAETIGAALLMVVGEKRTLREAGEALNVPKNTIWTWHTRFRKGHLRFTDAGVQVGDGLRPWSADSAVRDACCELDPTAKAQPKKPSMKQQALNQEVRQPVDAARLQAEIRKLEEENARLVQQITWAQEADSPNRTGGVLTIRRSDDHHGDKNHLLSCGESLLAKALVLVGQYKPDRVQLIGWDDWVAGSGIYKEQDLDCVTSDPEEQVNMGVMKTRRYLIAIRNALNDDCIPIHGYWLRGNHDFSKGVSISQYMHTKSLIACADIPACQLQFCHDNATVNLASEGTYNVLVRHGFGYSQNSPNSPAFEKAIFGEILFKQNKMEPHEHYRRVLSGHTHWLSIGLERNYGLWFDTTGGLQRNTRIRIGDNQRPVGWIVYVSPAGLKGNICHPIPLRPEDSVYRREIADPHLAAANMRDVSECLQEYRELFTERGLLGPADNFGKLNEGRY